MLDASSAGITEDPRDRLIVRDEIDRVDRRRGPEIGERQRHAESAVSAARPELDDRAGTSCRNERVEQRAAGVVALVERPIRRAPERRQIRQLMELLRRRQRNVQRFDERLGFDRNDASVPA